MKVSFKTKSEISVGKQLNLIESKELFMLTC